MPSLDVFTSNAFNMFELTAAINKFPYQPKFLRDLGIFKPVPIRTTTAAVEDQRGTLALIHSAGRGSMRDVRTRPRRTIRNFNVPHFPVFDTIMADEVQNVRAFGSETELEAVADIVNESLAELRLWHETTMEFHRVGAVQGKVYDSDGTTLIYDYFAEFDGISQTTVNITLASGDVKAGANAVVRAMSTALGMTQFTKVIALCGDTFFDALTANAGVKAAYDNWSAAVFLKQSQIGPEYNANTAGFDFANITWVNYRGQIGDVPFFPATEARAFPIGVPDLFLEVMAPADFVETVNTRGLPFYAKQQLMDFDKGVELHTQHNVLMIPTRPAALIRITNT